jgi:Tol biopolymer transport system component
MWGLFDFDIYTSLPDGSDLRRLTTTNGYTAEATLSPDGNTIVFTSVMDGDLEIYTMKVDGSDIRRLTETPGYDGGPFFSPDGTMIVYRAWHPTDPPYFHPDGRRIIFASNHEDPRGRDFDLYLVGVDGRGLTQVTTHGDFDGFPMFSPDGTKLVFASNRKGRMDGETNIFVADWVEP